MAVIHPALVHPAIVHPAIVAASLVARWRATGPVLWWGAAAVAAAWVALLGVLALATDPRRVASGAPGLDTGDEPPAVVNLLTSDWVLTPDAVPATLIDLAARRHLTIEQLGGRTYVRVRLDAPPDTTLDRYEQMVLEHVRSLATRTTDGFVPGEALTTGPGAHAELWWRTFRAAVVDRARVAGLSRARWGAGPRAALGVGAVLLGVAVFVAATTLESTRSDDDPITTAIGLGLLAAAVPFLVTSRLRGERDTPAGRACAARWLGVRQALRESPTFADQPPAAVAIWDRLLAHGAAMGVAPGAVRTLPLGAESERRAWSPVGGRWRSVGVRYPQVLPPGYGRSPLAATVLGFALCAFGVVAARPAARVLVDLGGLIDDLRGDQALPVGARIAVALAVVVAGAFVIGVALVGVSLFLGGLGDLVRAPRTVDGLVLRVRARGDDQHRFWHVAVDDGTSSTVRAWRMGTPPPVSPGRTVQASVSPWLRHVRRIEQVPEPAPEPAPRAGASDPAPS